MFAKPDDSSLFLLIFIIMLGGCHNIKNVLKFYRLTENPWTCSCQLLEWKQGITNKKRSGKIPKKCINDLQRGEVRCTGSGNEYAYAFDNKLSPRCALPEDMKDRSVYYALRKNTKCTTKRTAIDAKSQVIRMKLKAMEEFVNNSARPHGKVASPLNKQRHDQFKVKYRKVMRNDIEYLLSKNEKRGNDEVRNEI